MRFRCEHDVPGQARLLSSLALPPGRLEEWRETDVSKSSGHGAGLPNGTAMSGGPLAQSDPSSCK